MIEIPSLRPETRYGIPPADLHLFNRQYILGYSFLFRQPRWALELIDPATMRMEEKDLRRLNNFRDDLRVPEMFRATLRDYRRSGFDRGHLIASADRLNRTVVNSETFLLSNMSPQDPGFNRGIWRALEESVRGLAKQKKYVEVYAICGPLFAIGDPIEVIGKNHVVVPDAFFKSILAEDRRGRLEMWTFAIPNADVSGSLSSFLRSTKEVERRAGLSLWIACGERSVMRSRAGRARCGRSPAEFRDAPGSG